MNVRLGGRTHNRRRDEAHSLMRCNDEDIDVSRQGLGSMTGLSSMQSISNGSSMSMSES